jgi:hypothetical protein
MPKYDMLCEKCGVVEIEHSIHEDHPKKHDCGGKMAVYFGNAKKPVINFVSNRGGGVDDWASQVAKGPQHPTSEESDVAYH